MYTLPYCYECVDCHKVLSAEYDVEYDMEKCPHCKGFLFTVSCQPETAPPVCTATWNVDSWRKWEAEQEKRCKRLDYLNETTKVDNTAILNALRFPTMQLVKNSYDESIAIFYIIDVMETAVAIEKANQNKPYCQTLPDYPVH